MILYYSDWANKYPEAIVDVDTRNRTFIDLAGKYKKMGCKNHAMILALHDKTLVGIDPHNKDLSPEIKARVLLECRVNFWYYLREVVRVPAESGLDAIQFRANRGNISLYWLFFNHITCILIQIRQTGKSLSVDVLCRYLLNIRCVNTSINLITKDDVLRETNLNRLKELEKCLPPYIQFSTPKDVNNTEKLTIKSLGNSYAGHLPQKSPKAAINVGRGLTSGVFHIDEAAYLYNIKLTLSAALSAGGAARDFAEENGEPYGTILTTTVGKLDDPNGKYIYNLVQESAVWTERFFDTENIVELEKIIRRSSSGNKLRVNCTFNHKQLGYSDAWLRRKMEEAIAEGETALADFLNRWMSGTMTSPLDKKVLERIHNSVKEDFITDISADGYITRWYANKSVYTSSDSKAIIMGLDTSDAVGSDALGQVTIDSTTGEVIAVGDYNETNLFKYARWLFNMLMEFPTLLLVPERKSSAVVMIDYLIEMLLEHGLDPYKRIFNWVVDESKINTSRYSEIDKPLKKRDDSVYTEHRKQFGYATSGSGRASRTQLYSVGLLSATKNTADTIHDKTLANQVLALTVKNGRLDHPVGSNDDLCVAWLLAYWLLTNGRNLEFYGINISRIMRANQLTKMLTSEELSNNIKQNAIRSKINTLLEQLNTDFDNMVIVRKERELMMLNELLVLNESEIFNMETYLKEIRERKRFKSKHRK